jgi:hypothetical protein
MAKQPWIKIHSNNIKMEYFALETWCIRQIQPNIYSFQKIRETKIYYSPNLNLIYSQRKQNKNRLNKSMGGSLLLDIYKYLQH